MPEFPPHGRVRDDVDVVVVVVAVVAPGIGDVEDGGEQYSSFRGTDITTPQWSSVSFHAGGRLLLFRRPELFLARRLVLDLVLDHDDADLGFVVFLGAPASATRECGGR